MMKPTVTSEFQLLSATGKVAFSTNDRAILDRHYNERTARGVSLRRVEAITIVKEIA